MATAADKEIAARYEELAPHFPKWEKIKDLIDQLIDLMLNYRQSGHPGGSRSKVHALVVTLLSGVMRWDIRHPEKRFGDRFILVAGHTIPLVYATLAVLNEAMRIKYQQTGDKRYLIPHPEERALYWEDLLKFRHNKGLSGHAEMEGKTLFLKFNTGPSGHGSPAAVGEAFALKRAGAGEVKVFAFEGDAGLTPGGAHEAKNSAWGLALDNLYYVVDWNDFGIDDHPLSTVVPGTPTEWFAPYGWRVFGTEQGNEWGPVTRAILEMVYTPNPDRAPSVTWLKTRKGRGYLKYDNISHGSPHKRNCELFWETKRPFAEKYGVTFQGFGECAPTTPEEWRAEYEANLKAVIDVLHRDQELIDYIADTLVALGESVPKAIPAFKLGGKNPFKDERLYDFRNYPPEMYVAPGTREANRAALSKWGSWVNAFGHEHYGRPLFIACSADLADSTQISGFAKPWGDFPGYGWYERYGSPGDIFWAEGAAFRPLTEEDVAPIHPEVDPNEKKVVVNVTQQTLSCLEGNREVYFCRVSTGVGAASTPLGEHITWRKAISIHMAGGTVDAGYDTPGVSWTTLFVGEGVAIHAAFWHNEFGMKRSHGCVNCRPEDAQWIFRWTTPAVPLEPGDVLAQWPNGGTHVIVQERLW